MTLRLFLVLIYWFVEGGFIIAAIAAKDEQKRQTRLLWAIMFSLFGLNQVLGAIAIHTGAYPLWNNK